MNRTITTTGIAATASLIALLAVHGAADAR